MAPTTAMPLAEPWLPWLQRSFQGLTWTRLDRRDGGAGASTTNTALYLGVGVGVGCLLLIAIVAVITRLVYKRVQHRKALARLETGHLAQEIIRTREISQVIRPVSSASGTGLARAHEEFGWNTLGSTESFHYSEPIPPIPEKRKRTSIAIAKRLKKGGIPLKRLKALSAIMESPRNEFPPSPIPDLPITSTTALNSTTSGAGEIPDGNALQGERAERDNNLPSESPRPDVLPTFAIGSPSKYGIALAHGENPRVLRSISVDAFTVPSYKHAAFGHQSWHESHGLHGRSISAMLPRTRPPSGPVPPLPASAPFASHSNPSLRHGVCVSRNSSSSQDSTGSSILVASPIIGRRNSVGRTRDSPNVEDVIANDEHASLRSGMNHQLRQSHMTSSRAGTSSALSRSERTRASVRGDIDKCDPSDTLQRESSVNSLDSALSRRSRRSAARNTAVNFVKDHRLSSSPSDDGRGSGLRAKSSASRRSLRKQSVSVTGSPIQRKRTGVLEDISGNANIKERPDSIAREDSSMSMESGHSSNGNPFQWDTESIHAVTKPSALKGSPNARKGHRRQNCVRISTLSPQVLGPTMDRSDSSSLMGGIQEEGEDDVREGAEDDTDAEVKQTMLSRPRPIRRPSRPISTDSKNDLRVQILRASLTSSSPTLSTWAALQDAEVPDLPSDARLLTPRMTRPPISRSSSEQSQLSIPLFPGISRPSVAAVQKENSVPEFCVSRRSTEEIQDGDSSSPFNLRGSTPPQTAMVHLSSSPPIFRSMATDAEEVEESTASLPVSPVMQTQDSISTSPGTVGLRTGSPLFRPFDVSEQAAMHAELCVSPKSRPTSMADLPESILSSSPYPVVSFHEDYLTCLAEVAASFRDPEKLTSENASRIMARITQAAAEPGQVSFPGENLPVLAPPSTVSEPILPKERDDDPPPVSTRRSFRRPRPASGYPSASRNRSPAPPLPTIPQSDDSPKGLASLIPSPLNLSVARFAPPTTASTVTATASSRPPSPLGPRAAPAQSVLRNAIALRRMNSEVLPMASRAQKRYVRLGREPSPLLPWVDAAQEGLPLCSSQNTLPDGPSSDDHDEAGDRSGEVGSPPASPTGSVDEDGTRTKRPIDESQYELRTMPRNHVPTASTAPEGLVNAHLDDTDDDTTLLSEDATAQDSAEIPAAQLEEETKLRGKFWDDVARFARDTSQASMKDLAKLSPQAWAWHPKMAFTRAGRTSSGGTAPSSSGAGDGTPKGNSVGTPKGETPKSLYDADGFLKT